MFCRNCGKEIGSDAKFCPECGAAQNDYAYQSDSSKDIKKENPNGNTESSSLVAVLMLSGASCNDSYMAASSSRAS